MPILSISPRVGLQVAYLVVPLELTNIQVNVVKIAWLWNFECSPFHGNGWRKLNLWSRWHFHIQIGFSRLSLQTCACASAKSNLLPSAFCISCNISRARLTQSGLFHSFPTLRFNTSTTLKLNVIVEMLACKLKS